MVNEQEFAELQDIVASTEKATKNALRQSRNITFALHHSTAAQDSVDRLRARLSKEGVAFACRKGCDYCCTLRVESLPQETFRIARELKARGDVSALVDQLRGYAKKVAGLRTREHYEACPFLRNNECSIYAFRPVMCRKYNSLDVEVCKQPDAPVPENGEMAYKSNAIITGTVSGYARVGLSSEPHELGQGVLRALTDPTAEQRWFKGERVFDPLPEEGVA